MVQERKYKYLLTVFIGSDQTLEIDINAFEKKEIFFGRSKENDIVIPSMIISSQHGWIRYTEGSWYLFDYNSTNGVWIHGNRVKEHKLMDGDTFYIGNDEMDERVVFIWSVQQEKNPYKKYFLPAAGEVMVGRSSSCQIVLAHMSVSRNHCKFICKNNHVYIEDCGSTNGVQVNGQKLKKRKQLREMDQITICNTQMIFSRGMIHYRVKQDGMSVQANSIWKTVGKGRTKKHINQDITISIQPCEFVAIVGGSGAGKSTLLNCLSGYTNISKGQVLVNGEDLHKNYNNLKFFIGYVPQKDIVYENLTLEQMLYYTAKLRMPEDTKEEEMEHRIHQVLEMIELTGYETSPIKSLSGGQKKRASIAVELLADPKLFFLDEPTSGLDPGTEKNLMICLKNMTKEKKTVVLVTHNTLNLHLCDKIIFLGYGGRLCFYGSPQEALEFFHTDNFVDIYNMVGEKPEQWETMFKRKFPVEPPMFPAKKKKYLFRKKETTKVSGLRQFAILSARYVKLISRDIKRLFLLLLMAPGLGGLLALAFGALYPFEASKDTMSFMFALSCCAFWVGMFNSIQEICKEQVIFQRERMAILKLSSYIGSKLVVLGVLCFIQSALLMGVVSVFVGNPEHGMLLPSFPWIELFITTCLTMFSAMTLGLFISSLSGNPDRAITLAPIFLVPQILFSGIACELNDIGEKISNLVTCRWACIAYCTTSNVNHLPTKITTDVLGGKVNSDITMVSMDYEFDLAENLNPIGESWIVLGIFIVVCIIGTSVCLKQRKNN